VLSKMMHHDWYLLKALICSLVLLGCHQSSEPLLTANSDTTTHAFVWQIDTIGAEGSYLTDVAVVNDTCAYAVGVLFPRDSAGQTNPSDPHNAVAWDGNHWKMIKVPYIYQGLPAVQLLKSIVAFSQNDIWFAGGGLVHWDGFQFNSDVTVLPFWMGHSMNKMWGSSGNNLYIVGDGGLITHFG
jgi:hypothetical protein